MRFGSEYVESALAAQDRELVVIDPLEFNKRLIGGCDGRAYIVLCATAR